MDQGINLLISKLRTKEDVKTLISEIELLETSLYEYGERGVDSTIKNSVRVWVSEVISESWGTKLPLRHKFLSDLKSKVSDLPVVNLTLAFEPSDAVLGRIYSKIAEVFGRSFVIDLSIQKKIIGGILVSFQGIYRDYSVSKLLESEDLQIEKRLKL